MKRRLLAPGAAFALVTLLGCAAMQPPVPAPAFPPAAPAGVGSSTAAPDAPSAGGAWPGVAVGNTASGGSIVSRGSQPAVVDSGPSAEALAVLASIPEPLAPAERVPAPAVAPESRAGAPPASGTNGAPAAGAASAAPATTATIAADDSLIPVPAPTEPLGDRPGTLARVVADTFPVMPPAAAPPEPVRARPDSCWRVQVAAPTDKQEADLKRQAAESVLLVPFVVEQEKTRYKLRNRDCLTREVADQLRRRAVESGFTGSFPVLEVKK